MPARRRTSHRRRRPARQVQMPFPLASPTEGTYREPGYQARIELYAQNHFTPAQYDKIKSRGISFVRGDADMIRHAFIGEPDLKKKVQEFTGSAYVYDLAHALLLQIKRTVQQLVNVPEGLTIQVLLAVLYNLKGFKLTGPGALGVVGDAPAKVQLTALSTTDLRTLQQKGTIKINNTNWTPVRVPDAATPKDTYPWSLTADRGVAVDCVVAQLLEVCREAKIKTEFFSLVQRSEVFTPLELESSNRQGVNYYGERDNFNTYGYFKPQYNGTATGNTASPGTFDNVIRKIQLPSNQSFGPTSVAGLDEVFRMEHERDSIIAILTQWGTTGLGLILDGEVGYDKYRRGVDPTDIMGNKPAYAQFAEVNEMGDTCGPGYERVWYTGEPGDAKTRSVPGHLYMNGVKYQNPQATHAVCAPMTRQLRSMPYSKDVVTNPRLGVAMQRRAKKRRPAKRRPAKRRPAKRRR